MNAAQDHLIDLDTAGVTSSERPGAELRYHWRRLNSTRVPALAVVGLLLLGVIGGGVVGSAISRTWQSPQHVLRIQQQVLASESTASVLAFIDPSSLLDGESSRNSDGPPMWAHIEGQLTVVNTGHLGVNVRTLAADDHGVSIRAAEWRRWLEPGETMPVDVVGTVPCTPGIPVLPVMVRVAVETADERSAEVSAPATLQGTPWQEFVDRACAQ